MKQFSVKEYLENPSRQVVARNGMPVRIICTDAKDEYPVIGLVEWPDGAECLKNFKKNGRHSCNPKNDNVFDLFFKPVKCEGWVNIYRVNNTVETGTIYTTKEEALSNALGTSYIDTVHIEWEEE